MIRKIPAARKPDRDPYAAVRTAARRLRDLTGGSGHQIAVILGTGWTRAADRLGTASYEIPLATGVRAWLASPCPSSGW